jgi:site-specific DNA-cytosine methylase
MVKKSIDNTTNPLFVELFAGCGGMSLGLETAGFQLFFANELSPMRRKI